jgi:hypothetical protein
MYQRPAHLLRKAATRCKQLLQTIAS